MPPKFILKPEAKPFEFFDEDGTSRSFPIFVNIETKKDAVQCNRCGFYLNAGYLTRHQQAATCKQKAASNVRLQNESVEREKLAETVRMLAEKSVSYPNHPPQNVADLSSSLASSSLSSQHIFSQNESEQLLPVTPIAGSTPRASFSNLMFDDLHNTCANDSDEELPLAPSSPLPGLFHPSANLGNDHFNDSNREEFVVTEDSDFYDRKPILGLENSDSNPCRGQPIQWTPGSVWDSYAYQMHDDDSLPWNLIGFRGNNFIIIQSRDDCTGFLFSAKERDRGSCNGCFSLLNSDDLRRFISRAHQSEAKSHTPWKYLNRRQLAHLLVKSRRKIQDLRLKLRNSRRKVGRLQKRVNDYQRVVIMLSKNRIAGVSRILSIALRNGASAEAICDKLQAAISGTYTPRSGWTQREFDVAFLIKALGGPRLLYTLQVAEGYPSLTTLRRHKKIPEIVISPGVPDTTEFTPNITSFLGNRLPPSDPRLGQVIMIDGVALEEVIHFDLGQNCLLGLCREHSQDIKKIIDTVGDIDNVKHMLDSGKCHRGKDGTVLAIAPITDSKDYYPVPLVVSPSCKTETGDQLVEWVGSFINAYREHPDGEPRHGPIHILATDGESSFRKLRATLGLRQLLDQHSPMGNILYQLPGLNLYTGLHGLLTTSDPKHIIKRYATLIRSKNGIQVGGTSLTSQDALQTLMCYPMTAKAAQSLLDPADKQNVPKAVNLVSSLGKIGQQEVFELPSIKARIERVVFLAKVLGCFVNVFTHVEMSLSEQIFNLSTYAHLITALYQKHRTGFLTSALLADSQAIIKNIFFTLARIQTINPDANYFILHEGTDRLEGVFSHARTQDHARNFDTLQLAQKLSIGAEINAIFQRYPELDRGHVRRNLVNVSGVDHVNPKSWLGNVRVGDVDIKKEYFAGRDQANQMIIGELHWSPTDFDHLFSNPDFDHLRPGGIYIGTRPSDLKESQDRDDLDDGLLNGGLLDIATSQLIAEAESNIAKDDNENDNENGSDIDANDNLNDLDTENENGNMESQNIFDPLATVSAMVDPCDEVDHAEQNAEVVVESDILNPLPTNIIHSQYLNINGKMEYKPDVVASILGGPDGKKVLSRPMRAAGLTIEASLRKMQNLNTIIGNEADDEDQIKSGDLGAILTRVNKTICLAVVEILGFTQGASTSKLLPAIKFDDLDAGGNKSISITVQILDLLPPDNAQVTQPESEDFSWTWGGNYVQIQRNHGKETAIMHRHFTTQISGTLFHPLSPHVVYNTDDKPVWSISHDNLKETLEEAWDILNPDTDEILTHIKSLPKISGPGLPYKYNEKPLLWLPDPTPPLTPSGSNPLAKSDYNAKSQVECKLCGKTMALGTMRTHIGKHVLLAHRELPDTINPGIEICADPCGWCGGEGCKTQLTLQKGTKLTTTSNCRYHFKGMQYSNAATFRVAAPCTNVPLHCPLCPLGPTGQPPTFWKYCFTQHMVMYHTDENLKSTPIPFDLLKKVHISLAEGMAMGVGPESMMKYREDYGIPNSDAFEAEPLNRWDTMQIRLGRKRTGSEVSKTSSSERDISPTKIQRM